MVIVLMGKSAVGKDTVLNELVSEFDLTRVVSATNRVPREGETDGKDYHFVTAEQFDEMIKNNEFIEHVEFNGVKYGCPKMSIDLDKDMCIVVETNGAKAFIEEFGKENVFVVNLTLDDKKRYERASNRSKITFEEWQNREASDDERFKEDVVSELANFDIRTDDEPYVVASIIVDALEAYKECQALNPGEKCVVAEVYDECNFYDFCKAYTELDYNKMVSDYYGEEDVEFDNV